MTRRFYQGRSVVDTVVGAFEVGSFADGRVFTVPLDIPDLPESVRDFYTSDELQGLAAGDLPFTIRVRPVPEPASMALVFVAMSFFGLGLFCRRTR